MKEMIFVSVKYLGTLLAWLFSKQNDVIKLALLMMNIEVCDEQNKLHISIDSNIGPDYQFVSQSSIIAVIRRDRACGLYVWAVGGTSSVR
jgi:hypothetical protein